MTALLARPPTTPERAPRPEATVAPRRRHGVSLFIALAGLYFAVGAVLMMRYNLFDPDATSRVANTGYALMSRDPHLSAIGFVWNPLPSLVQMPILPFARWWPELRTYGLAGVIQSALFMSGAALMVRRIALDRAVGSGWRRIAVACFALQPMIIVYGASGMSEAAEIFCLLWFVRHLMQWCDHRRIADLAWAGVALGVGYLARYEVVPAALGITVLIAVMVARDAAAGSRLPAVAANIAILLFPLGNFAAVWAVTGWVLNHELFATVSSQYGNARQVADAIQRGYLVRDPTSEWVIISARLLGMQPFVGIAAAAGMAHAALSRTTAALVPVLTFGPVLAFAAWGQYSATTFGLFRYFILAIPMTVCIALGFWTPADSPRSAWTTETSSGRLAAALLCASILIGFPVTASAMLNERINNPPFQGGFTSLLHPQRYPAQEQWYRQMATNGRLMADYLDRQRLSEGSVLMDTSYTGLVWLSSVNPKQFVVTSDDDFKAALNRPWEYGVTYLLVSNPSFTNADAVNLRYPTLWNDGAGFSKLVYSMSVANNEERFRIFEVTGPPRTVLSPPS